MQLAAVRYKIDLKVTFEDLPPKHQHILVYGPPKGEAPRTGFHGILAYLRDNADEARSDSYREYMMSFMSAVPCPVCRGKRLRPESLAVKIGGLSIADFTALPLNRALSAAINLQFTAREALIAERIRREIAERLEFLCAVGLSYLSLDRNATTLSGGEGQRIRLATQIGSRLRGVLYVLDEPSIGLHQRDNNRLIEALEKLRDLGNTVLVVEHDEETIRHADFVLDLGLSGRLGGNVVAKGTPEEIMASPASAIGHGSASCCVVRAPASIRMASSTLPGIILLGWFIASPRKLCRTIVVLLTVGIFLVIPHAVTRFQSVERKTITSPDGQLAVADPERYEEYQWVLLHAHASDYLHEAAGPDMYFYLDLRNPTPLPFLTNCAYTTTEQVAEATRGLAQHRVQYVVWSPSQLDTIPDWEGPGDNHLGPLRDYLHDHYRIVKVFANSDEVWERIAE